jgi:hypothetical protein
MINVNTHESSFLALGPVYQGMPALQVPPNILETVVRLIYFIQMTMVNDAGFV